MRFLRNFFLVIILGYGLAYGYLWYETYNTLERISKSAAPFAKVEYDSFFVSPLANEVTVDNISIVPQMAPDEFRIDQVRLYTDMPGYLAISGMAVQSGMLPETMNISLTNLQLNLASKLFGMLEEMSAMSQQPQQDPGALANLDALGCGDIDEFQLVDYRLMGIKRVNVDLKLHLSYDKIGEVFSVQTDANFRGIYSVNMTTSIAVPEGQMNNVTQTKKIPPVRLTINDTGYYKMRNAYCAAANESSVEEYVDNHINLLSSTLGAKLPENIASTYRKHMLEGGRMTVSIRPRGNVSPDELAYYKPLEVVDMLGLKITIGKTRIDLENLLGTDALPALAESAGEKKPVSGKPEDVKAAEAKPKDTAKSQSARQPAAAKPVAAQKTVKAPSTNKATYHVVKVENAQQHIDKMVEVTLPGNKVRRGMLEKVRNNRLYLLMELHAGTLTYPVKISEIRKFRVLY